MDTASVRCSSKVPTPYLRRHWRLLVPHIGSRIPLALDLGCGNGRNTWFLRKQGFAVVPLDKEWGMHGRCVLGADALPVRDAVADAVIANYLFMFLDRAECAHLCSEIRRVGRPGCRVMVELYPSLRSYTPTEPEMLRLQDALLQMLCPCSCLRHSRGRFVV